MICALVEVERNIRIAVVETNKHFSKRVYHGVLEPPALTLILGFCWLLEKETHK